MISFSPKDERNFHTRHVLIEEERDEKNKRADAHITKETSTGLLCYEYRIVRYETAGYPANII